MSEKNERSQILNDVILGYRNVIKERYEFKSLKNRNDFPDSFNEERVNKFKAYFLDYLYPMPAKRAELNEAFEGLEEYIKHPNKLLQVLIDSSSLIFKYGRHLPKILRTGMKALRSFQTANHFEEKLVDKAILLNLNAPYSNLEIDQLISTLSPEDIEEFIESGQNLFETLHDRELVSKIKNIMDHLIQKMKKRPNVYSAAEVKGLEIGKEIIVEGDLLFAELSKEEQDKIFKFIVKLEREVLEEIFKKK